MIVIVEIIYPAFLRWAVQCRHRLSLCTEPPHRTWHPSEDTSKVIVLITRRPSKPLASRRSITTQTACRLLQAAVGLPYLLVTKTLFSVCTASCQSPAPASAHSIFNTVFCVPESFECHKKHCFQSVLRFVSLLLLRKASLTLFSVCRQVSSG